MKLSFVLLLFISCFFSENAIAQHKPLLHSHNDYYHKIPFLTAYHHGFSSIEVDVILKNGELYVAHSEDEIVENRTIESLYLQPLLAQAEQGFTHSFTLLVDVKREAKGSLEQLKVLLEPHKGHFYPYTQKNAPKIVISGSRPLPKEMGDCPEYLFFDGRIEEKYDEKASAKVPLISLPFARVSRWNGKGNIPAGDLKKLRIIIDKVHAQGKKIRFWGTPDTKTTWKAFARLGIDYINTDKVEQVAGYFDKLERNEFQSAVTHPIYTPRKRDFSNKKPQNIILLIGDGMGITQIYSGYTANKGQLSLFQMPVTGLSITQSADSYITDSAAGATAMATGNKSNNRMVGTKPDSTKAVSLTEIARQKQMKTGVISMGDITDATPAAFYAHQPNRNMSKEIAQELLSSSLDFAVGSGAHHFSSTSVSDELPQNIKTGEKCIVVYPNEKMNRILDGREELFGKVFTSALEHLTNKKGFFLMAEGAQIDIGGHFNDFPYVVSEVLDFDKVIGKALEYADKHQNTLVIVTADHETGGLSLLDGDVQKGYVEGSFSTNDHSAVMVPVFAYGPGAELFQGVYQNTEIFHKILSLIK
ncbi:alkaline phosphatase [Rapidithrix thailandica]|uniref:Alkaline phosphatase n=1 Tax=Rapidithrix thailandica TaxID=413964 RepID=A0AAW9S371_9BACT